MHLFKCISDNADVIRIRNCGDALVFRGWVEFLFGFLNVDDLVSFGFLRTFGMEPSEERFNGNIEE